jgi:hypothetical protein
VNGRSPQVRLLGRPSGCQVQSGSGTDDRLGPELPTYPSQGTASDYWLLRVVVDRCSG